MCSSGGQCPHLTQDGLVSAASGGTPGPPTPEHCGKWAGPWAPPPPRVSVPVWVKMSCFSGRFQSSVTLWDHNRLSTRFGCGRGFTFLHCRLPLSTGLFPSVVKFGACHRRTLPFGRLPSDAAPALSSSSLSGLHPCPSGRFWFGLSCHLQACVALDRAVPLLTGFQTPLLGVWWPLGHFLPVSLPAFGDRIPFTIWASLWTHLPEENVYMIILAKLSVIPVSS